MDSVGLSIEQRYPVFSNEVWGVAHYRVREPARRATKHNTHGWDSPDDRGHGKRKSSALQVGNKYRRVANLSTGHTNNRARHHQHSQGTEYETPAPPS